MGNNQMTTNVSDTYIDFGQQVLNVVDEDALREVANKYRVPESEQVQILRKRTKNGYVDLRYTSHATVTQILNEIDPTWEFEFVSERGIPITVDKNGTLTAFGHLTLLGKRILAVGSCDSSKAEWAKELYGDCLRNAAMRAGIHIALWEKDFPEDEQKKPANKTPKNSGGATEDKPDKKDETIKEAVEVVQERLEATVVEYTCGGQPERFSQWPAVQGCGNSMTEVDGNLVMRTKTYLCPDCAEKWVKSIGGDK